MKKIILAFFVFATVATEAQTFEKGQMDFNVGMGLINTFISKPGFGYGLTYRATPTFNVSGEYAITDAIGVGGYLGFCHAKYTYTGIDDWHSTTTYTYVDELKWTFLIMGARAAYHFGQFIKVDKLDVYAGLMTGFNLGIPRYTSTDPYHVGYGYYGMPYSPFAWSVFGGARYRFTDKIGVFGELGYGINVFNLGLNIKL